MANEGYHEPIEELSDETKDMHKAIVSLMEELEAVDWYNQRVDACKDKELKAILRHNRDEEKEYMLSVLSPLGVSIYAVSFVSLVLIISISSSSFIESKSLINLSGSG